MKIISEDRLLLLFVLGRYNKKFQGNPKKLDVFIQEHKKACLFQNGQYVILVKKETECLI